MLLVRLTQIGLVILKQDVQWEVLFLMLLEDVSRGLQRSRYLLLSPL